MSLAQKNTSFMKSIRCLAIPGLPTAALHSCSQVRDHKVDIEMQPSMKVRCSSLMISLAKEIPPS